MKFTKEEINLKQPYHKVRLVDIAVLLVNLFKAARHPQVGHLDADHTTDMYIQQLGRQFIWIPRSLLESGLAAANMLDEVGEFWDVREQTFDEFVHRQKLNGHVFDKQHNFLTKRDKY